MKHVHRTVTIALVLIALAHLSYGQFRESVERNGRVYQSVRGCLEGYAEALGGEVIDYPRIREDRSQALITRATNGTMAIEWLSQRTPPLITESELCFVVSAGIMARPNTVVGFRLIVNDKAQCRFSTIDTLGWQAADSNGVRLVFDGTLRDQHTDAFGYLRIYVPREMVTPGQSVRFKAVGDSAGSRVWFMVFKDDGVVNYLADRTSNESFCDVLFEPSGKKFDVSMSAPSSWLGRPVTLLAGNGTPLTVNFTSDSLGARASFFPAARSTDRFRVTVGNETVIDIQGLSDGVQKRDLYPSRLALTDSRSTPAGGFSYQYRSIYTPLLAPALTSLSDITKKENAIHLIVSTHQDIAWMDSPEQCIRDRDEKILTPALEIMKSNPLYRFDLEDVLFLREYLERHPDRKDDLYKFISEGRLGIGASYNQPYEDLCSGEMLVREFYAGRKWLRKNFPGCEALTYCNPDVPGRTLQMAQILKKSGVNQMLISRFERGLYTWESPDGSGVLTFSPGHYGDFFERVGRKGFPEMASYIASFGRVWSSSLGNGSANIPIVSMSDMSTPVRFDDILDTWNKITSLERSTGGSQVLSLPTIRYSNTGSFLNAVSSEGRQFPVVRGERPNIWLYIHGPTHHRAISAKREADVLLPAAETFSTIDALLSSSFARYPQKELTSAWESQIYPDHGWGGKNGETTDSTFWAKYEFARTTGKSILSRSLAAIASRIRTAPAKGIPVVVFNSLSWTRTAPVQFKATFAPGLYTKGVALHDAGGRPLPSQILSVDRHADGSLRSVDFLFVATDVPPVGYTTYYVRPSPRVAVPDTVSRSPGILQNRYYRVLLGEGGIRQLVDIELKKELFAPSKFLGGELFTMQSVGEDAGEWSEPQQPSMEGFEKIGQYRPQWKIIENGPLRQVVEVRQEMTHATVIQRVILYSDVKQIDIEASLLKWDGTRYREFRLAFPMNTSAGRVTYEVPFGTVGVGTDEMKGIAGERYRTPVAAVRPRSIQNWIDVSDNDIGVTFASSVAAWDYLDPTDQPASVPLLQPILLASRRSCHGAGPWYLQTGDHQFRFSLTSHRPGWKNGRRFGVGSNTPLSVVYNPDPATRQSLPEEKGFFSVSVENIALSTIKKCEDDNSVIIRVFEDSGKDVTAKLRMGFPLRGLEMTNMIEEEGTPGKFNLDEVTFGITHNAIQTMKLIPLFR
jgi:alpha-mannosidase